MCVLYTCTVLKKKKKNPVTVHICRVASNYRRNHYFGFFFKLNVFLVNSKMFNHYREIKKKIDNIPVKTKYYES